jgi:hypothetical protein
MSINASQLANQISSLGLERWFFDEAANGVTLWVKSGGRDIFNLMRESGEPATA